MGILEKNSPEVKELLGILDQIAACAEYIVENHVPHLGGDRFLDGKEVCRLLKIRERALTEYRSKGIIAYYKLGGRILYKQSDIEKVLRDNYCPAYGK